MTKLKQKQPAWYGDLSPSPFDNPQFTPEIINQIMHDTLNQQKKPRNRSVMIIRSIIGASLISLALLFLIVFRSDRQETIGLSDAWKPYSSYSIGDNIILEGFPGGDYEAGKTNGCWWNIYKPIETLEGKTVKINAIHKETGMEIQELSPTIITESMSYDNFTRISSPFALPLAGTWKFEMTLNDNQKLGELIYEVPESSIWSNSPDFISGAYHMTGIKDKIGIINSGFIAGKDNKYMWHFWGTQQQLSGSMEVMALKQGTSELLSIFKGTPSLGELNGANASMASIIRLPTSGQWRLMIYINKLWFGSIIVQVEDK